MTYRTWLLAVGTARVALLLALAHAQATPPAGLPTFTCEAPLPDPFLAAVALQPADLPEGWRVVSSCILIVPPSVTPNAPPLLNQGLFDESDFEALTQGGSISGLLFGSVDVEVYSTDAAAATRYVAFETNMSPILLPVVFTIGVAGQPLPQISTSVESLDLPAPALGDDAANLEVDVTDTAKGQSIVQQHAHIVFRRGRAIVSVDVIGDERREALALQLAQTLDAHVEAPRDPHAVVAVSSDRPAEFRLQQRPRPLAVRPHFERVIGPALY